MLHPGRLLHFAPSAPHVPSGGCEFGNQENYHNFVVCPGVYQRASFNSPLIWTIPISDGRAGPYRTLLSERCRKHMHQHATTDMKCKRRNYRSETVPDLHPTSAIVKTPNLPIHLASPFHKHHVSHPESIWIDNDPLYFPNTGDASTPDTTGRRRLIAISTYIVYGCRSLLG